MLLLPRSPRADGKLIDGSVRNRNTLLDCHVWLVSYNTSQRQLHLRAEVNIWSQVKVRVTWLRSDNTRGYSRYTAVYDAECKAWRGAWQNTVSLGHSTGHTLDFKADFTNHTEETTNARDRVRPTGLWCSEDDRQTNLNTDTHNSHLDYQVLLEWINLWRLWRSINRLRSIRFTSVLKLQLEPMDLNSKIMLTFLLLQLGTSNLRHS